MCINKVIKEIKSQHNVCLTTFLFCLAKTMIW